MSDDRTNHWPDLDKRRKRLRLASYDYSDPHHVYFVTLCAHDRSQPFLDPSLAQQVAEAICFRSSRHDWCVYTYCLMPDHLHLALSPEPGKGGLPQLMQGFKSFTTRLAWRHGLQGALWQRSYYDHIARREEDLRAICEYILANPVRRGLVDDAKLWPYSGAPDPFPA
ncbi:MAG: transposase [Chloroflexota bacterium]|nr:MAG: transposase [Chloroflexota bacterium]